MTQTLADVEGAAEVRGWKLHAGNPKPRSLTLFHHGRVVHRLNFSSYAVTSGELVSVGVTPLAARTLAHRITGAVFALEAATGRPAG